MTAISWADETWNPIRARNRATGAVGWYCEHVSDGCKFCYAETMNVRQRWGAADRLGLGTGLPYKPGHRQDVEIFLDEDALMKPLKWRKPRIVFPCSMTDLFGDWVSDKWLDRMFDAMFRARHHRYRLLTKRPERMRDYMCGSMHQYGADEPADWLWFGVSVEDQPTADERIPILRDTPAAHRWVSYEPALAGVDFHGLRDIDYLVCGGESGPERRPFDLAWAESAMAQCRDTGTGFHFKQDGHRLPGQRGRASAELWAAKDMPGRSQMTDAPTINTAGLVLPLAVKPYIDSEMRTCVTVYRSVDALEDRIAWFLPEYWRWVVEGKVPYASRAGQPRQYYHDNYHDNIGGPDEAGIYNFRFQLDDGPEGDTWVAGRFKIDGRKIVVLDKREYVS